VELPAPTARSVRGFPSNPDRPLQLTSANHRRYSWVSARKWHLVSHLRSHHDTDRQLDRCRLLAEYAKNPTADLRRMALR
jgi:hypothetical protein